MLESIKLSWAWLGAQNAALPYLATTLLFYLTCYGVRKKLPGVWRWIASLLPFADGITAGEDVARQFIIALPQVIASAALAGIATGDFKNAIFGAIAGAGAPLLHHTRKALPFDPYRGEIGKPKAKDPKDPPDGSGTKDPEPTRIRFTPPDPEPPSAAIRTVHPGWRLATVGLLAFLLGSAGSLTGCSSAAMQTQREASSAVAHIANDTVKPMLVAAFKASGKVVLDAEPNPELAQYKLNAHVDHWKPVWVAWALFKEANDAWQKQLETGGDPLPAAAQARDSFCKLRAMAAPLQVELPNLPAPLACGGGS